VSQIYDWATEQHHESSADTVLTATLLLRWVNEGLGEVATAARWKWLEGQVELQFGAHGAGANTSLGVTYLPHHIQQLESVWPSGLTYRAALEIIGAWELDMLGPAATGGIPNYLIIWGYYSVARDNPTTGTIVATDAGGSTAQVVVEGIDNNGLEVSELGTLVAGVYTTTAQFAAGPDGVRRVYVVPPGTGTGVVTFTRGGTAIETLNAGQGEFVKERLRTELSPPPVAGTANYILRYFKRIRPVRRVTDVVDIPFEFENLLYHSIDRRLALFRGDMGQAAYHEQSFRARVRELKSWQNRQGGRMRGQTRMIRRDY
jgi:hypothetical protein